MNNSNLDKSFIKKKFSTCGAIISWKTDYEETSNKKLKKVNTTCNPNSAGDYKYKYFSLICERGLKYTPISGQTKKLGCPFIVRFKMVERGTRIYEVTRKSKFSHSDKCDAEDISQAVPDASQVIDSNNKGK